MNAKLLAPFSLLVAADMARMAAGPVAQRWWNVCKPCRPPQVNRGPDEWGAGMEEVFPLD